LPNSGGGLRIAVDVSKPLVTGELAEKVQRLLTGARRIEPEVG